MRWALKEVGKVLRKNYLDKKMNVILARVSANPHHIVRHLPVFADMA